MIDSNVFEAAVAAYAKAVGDGRTRDALEYIRAARKAANGLPPAWTAQAEAELVAQILAHAARRNAMSQDVPALMLAVCREMGVTPEEVTGRCRHPSVVMARSVIFYLIRQSSRMSYPEIASCTGMPNHSTVITSVKRMQQMLAQPGDTVLVGNGGQKLECEHPRLIIERVLRCREKSDAAVPTP